MKKIFFGFLFLLFNLNIQDGRMLLNLLPDCIGYVLLLLGSRELASQASAFSRVPIPAAISAVYSLISWILDVLGITLAQKLLTNLLTLGNLLFSVWISGLIVRGILQLQTRWGDLGGVVLRRRWRFSVLFQCLTYLLSILLLAASSTSLITLISMVASVCMIPTLVFYVLVVLSVYRAWKQYDQRRNYPQQE